MTSQHLRRLNKKTFSLYEFTERSMTLRFYEGRLHVLSRFVYFPPGAVVTEARQPHGVSDDVPIGSPFKMKSQSIP